MAFSSAFFVHVAFLFPDSGVEDNGWGCGCSSGSHTVGSHPAVLRLQLNLDKVRQVLDKFLEAFPLLYGYWKRLVALGSLFRWEG